MKVAEMQVGQRFSHNGEVFVYISLMTIGKQYSEITANVLQEEYEDDSDWGSVVKPYLTYMMPDIEIPEDDLLEQQPSLV